MSFLHCEKQLEESVILITRMLAANIPALAIGKKYAVYHIPHKYAKEKAYATVLVSTKPNTLVAEVW